MKKKLDTRFPAARIKKIMQADEEVGKIAMATPVLISKALELFLQDLCDRTYDITLKRGAKTMTSFHLKECVRSHRVFDFLGEIVSRVPDLGSDTGGDNGRRRKMAADGDNDDSCEEDVKRSRGELQAISTRGRGRGRSRGRGRGSSEKQRVRVESDNLEDQEALSSPQLSDECEGYAQMSPETKLHEGESSEITIAAAASRPMPKDFDLNMDLDEHGEVAGVQKEEQQDAYTHPAWIASTSNQDNSQVINIQLHQSQNVLQPEEDYDCEDEN